MKKANQTTLFIVSPVIIALISLAIVFMVLLVYGDVRTSILMLKRSQERLDLMQMLITILFYITLIIAVLMVVDFLRFPKTRWADYKVLGFIGAVIFREGMNAMVRVHDLSTAKRMSDILYMDRSLALLVVGIILLTWSFIRALGARKGYAYTVTFIEEDNLS